MTHKEIEQINDILDDLVSRRYLQGQELINAGRQEVEGKLNFCGDEVLAIVEHLVAHDDIDNTKMYFSEEGWDEWDRIKFNNDLDWSVVYYFDGDIKLQHDTSLSSILDCGKPAEDYGIEKIESCWNGEDLR